MACPLAGCDEDSVDQHQVTILRRHVEAREYGRRGRAFIDIQFNRIIFRIRRQILPQQGEEFNRDLHGALRERR